MGEQDMAPALEELTKEKRDTEVGHTGRCCMAVTRTGCV